MKTTILLSIFIIIFSARISQQKSAIVSVKRVFEEVNKARTDPGSYKTKIETDILAHIVNCVHTQWNLTYSECTTAINDAINFLNGRNGIEAVTLHQGLTRSAYDHSVWQN